MSRNGAEIRVAIRHGPYLPHVARHFDDYIQSVVPVRVGERRVADFSVPKLHLIPDLRKEFLFTSLPEMSRINDEYLTVFDVKPGGVIIDAGAYCGLTTYLFARAVGPSGRIVAVEADPQNYAALAANLQRHGVQNALPIHAAVWKEAATLKFSAEGNTGSAVSATGPRSHGQVDVQAMTLMEICDRAGVDKVDHVKMDIEGAEYEVIPASGEFIEKHRADFIIEAHNEGSGPVNVEKLREFFAGMRYGMRHTPSSGMLHFYPAERSG